VFKGKSRGGGAKAIRQLQTQIPYGNDNKGQRQKRSSTGMTTKGKGRQRSYVANDNKGKGKQRSYVANDIRQKRRPQQRSGIADVIQY